MSRDVKYSFLAEIIEADRRFEPSFRRLPVLSSQYVDPFCEDKAVIIVINQVVKKDCPAMYKKIKNTNRIFRPMTPVKRTLTSKLAAIFIDNMCVQSAKRKAVNSYPTKMPKCLFRVNWENSYEVSSKLNLIVLYNLETVPPSPLLTSYPTNSFS